MKVLTAVALLAACSFGVCTTHGQVFSQTAPVTPPSAGAAAAPAAPVAPAPVAAPRAVNPPAVQPPPQAVIFGRGAAGPRGAFGGGGYGLTFSSGEDDAEIAKLNEAEHELGQQSQQLISEYGQTEDYEKREPLKKQLREVLAKQFDLQRQRRELELSRVEERLSKLREQLKKRNDSRNSIIDRRLENMISDAEGLGWGPPAGGNSAFGPVGAPPRGIAR